MSQYLCGFIYLFIYNYNLTVTKTIERLRQQRLISKKGPIKVWPKLNWPFVRLSPTFFNIFTSNFKHSFTTELWSYAKILRDEQKKIENRANISHILIRNYQYWSFLRFCPYFLIFLFENWNIKFHKWVVKLCRKFQVKILKNEVENRRKDPSWFYQYLNWSFLA